MTQRDDAHSGVQFAPMFLVIVCGTFAIAVLVYMLLGTRPNSGAKQRRYPRLELAVPVRIHTNDELHDGESRNISQGGMLLSARAPVSIAEPIRLRFTLPTETQVEIPAVVTYKKGEQIGVRFDPTHHSRLEVERWLREFRAEKPPEGAAASRS